MAFVCREGGEEYSKVCVSKILLIAEIIADCFEQQLEFHNDIKTHYVVVIVLME